MHEERVFGKPDHMIGCRQGIIFSSIQWVVAASKIELA